MDYGQHIQKGKIFNNVPYLSKKWLSRTVQKNIFFSPLNSTIQSFLMYWTFTLMYFRDIFAPGFIIIWGVKMSKVHQKGQRMKVQYTYKEKKLFATRKSFFWQVWYIFKDFSRRKIYLFSTWTFFFYLMLRIFMFCSDL